MSLNLMLYVHGTQADYVDMGGPLLLAEDVAEGVKFENGKFVYTDKPGLG